MSAELAHVEHQFVPRPQDTDGINYNGRAADDDREHQWQVDTQPILEPLGPATIGLGDAAQGLDHEGLMTAARHDPGEHRRAAGGSGAGDVGSFAAVDLLRQAACRATESAVAGGVGGQDQRRAQRRVVFD